MLTFSHAASRGRIGNTPLPTDLVDLIGRHAIDRHYHARCHICAHPVLVERLDAWIEPGRCVRYEVRDDMLCGETGSYRRGVASLGPPTASDIVLDADNGVARTGVASRHIRVGSLQFENLAPQLYQTMPYHVVGDRFTCCVCRLELRKLRRILSSWRSLIGRSVE